jgi:hypothetical protein
MSDFRAKGAKGVVAPEAMRASLAELTREYGESAVAHLLGIRRETLLRVTTGSTVYQTTIDFIREREKGLSERLQRPPEAKAD